MSTSPLPRRSAEEELAECKGSLAELVDEVMYLEGTVESEKAKTELMRTLLSELIGIDVAVVDALEEYAAGLERGAASSDLRSHKNNLLARRATFYDGVRARLRDRNLSLPAATNVESFDPSASAAREQQLRSRLIDLEKECARLRVGNAPAHISSAEARGVHVSRSGSVTVDKRGEDDVQSLRRALEEQRQRFEAKRRAYWNARTPRFRASKLKSKR